MMSEKLIFCNSVANMQDISYRGNQSAREVYFNMN